jgi:hypothetical protein
MQRPERSERFGIIGFTSESYAGCRSRLSFVEACPGARGGRGSHSDSTGDDANALPAARGKRHGRECRAGTQETGLVAEASTSMGIPFPLSHSISDFYEAIEWQTIFQIRCDEPAGSTAHCESLMLLTSCSVAWRTSCAS